MGPPILLFRQWLRWLIKKLKVRDNPGVKFNFVNYIKRIHHKCTPNETPTHKMERQYQPLNIHPMKWFKLKYIFDKLQLTQVQIILLIQYFFFQDFELKAVNRYTFKDVGLGLYRYNFYDITQKRLMYWHQLNAAIKLFYLHYDCTKESHRSI